MVGRGPPRDPGMIGMGRWEVVGEPLRQVGGCSFVPVVEGEVRHIVFWKMKFP